MKRFIAEFKEFINRGNVLDLAVGVVIGGAFTAIITAVVEGLRHHRVRAHCSGRLPHCKSRQ